MKISYRSIFLLLMVMAMAWGYTSCSEEDLPNNGKPRIRYIRVTDPVSSDSLLTSAFQDNMVAIVGDNLQGAQEIWFNDREASLVPTYITNTTILTTVPSQIPEVITNKLTIIFANGETLTHDFVVAISEPAIDNMECEFVETGGIATIRGNFFYEPITVTFAGGVTGDVISIDETVLEVVVPEGAEPGPITITTNFGETESDFWFRDNRNVFISNDPFTGWWGGDLLVNGSDALAINGNFIRMNKTIAAWAWTEMMGGPASALGTISKNIPDDAVLNPEDYYLKFEVNTLKPYNGNRVKIMLGQVTSPDPDWNAEPYYWEAPFDTEGEWQTVSIPFEEVVANYVVWDVNPDGYGVKIWFHGPGELAADMAFDTFRVVPKIIED